MYAQISTEESSFSPTRPVPHKPLKPALKRPSVVERPTELPTSKNCTCVHKHTQKTGNPKESRIERFYISGKNVSDSELLFIRRCVYYICYKYHIFYIIFLYRFPFAPCHQDKILIRVQAWQKNWLCFRWVEEGCKAVYIGSLVTVLTHIAFQSIEHLKYRITNQTQGIGAKWKWRHLEQHTCFLSHVGMPFRWERCYELHT